VFSAAQYSGVDKVPYEGKYMLRGEPIHISKAPYNTKLEFTVILKLNCDDVVI